MGASGNDSSLVIPCEPAYILLDCFYLLFSDRQLADVLLSQGRIPEAQRVLDLLKIEEIREFTSQTRAAWTSDGIALTEVEKAIQQAYGNIIGLTQAFNDCELNTPGTAELTL